MDSIWMGPTASGWAAWFARPRPGSWIPDLPSGLRCVCVSEQRSRPRARFWSAYRLFRLNSDGSADNTYTPPGLPPATAFQSFPFVRDLSGDGQYLAIFPIRLLSGAASTPDDGLL